MNEVHAFAAIQYEYVRQSRSALLEYCATITPSDFLQENSSFGRGSIRNLLVHVANTYEYWIGKVGLQKEMTFTEYESVSQIKEVEGLFDQIDKLMEEFLTATDGLQLSTIDYKINEKHAQTNAGKLFTHVITHEFHHKGQILSLSRHLGYIPVDTDVIR